LIQRKRNIQQLTYFAVLASIIVLLALFGGENDGVDFDKHKFILDENEVITTVVLEGGGTRNKFEYLNGAWEVNDTYLLDQGMRDVFFAVLSQVEVKRPVAASEKDSLATFLKNTGVKVSIYNSGVEVKSYLAGGNEEQFRTYFMDVEEGQPYLMHIPGYQSYIAGIFEARESDWRSRFIWDIDWTSLKKLTVKFGEKVTVFEYKDNFMAVEGVARLDTASMMSYLEEVAFLQTDKYLEPGEIEAYEEIIRADNPIASLQVEQIGDRHSSLLLFERPKQKQYIPGLLNNQQMLLFQPTLLENLKKTPKDFESDK